MRNSEVSRAPRSDRRGEARDESWIDRGANHGHGCDWNFRVEVNTRFMREPGRARTETLILSHGPSTGQSCAGSSAVNFAVDPVCAGYTLAVGGNAQRGFLEHLAERVGQAIDSGALRAVTGFRQMRRARPGTQRQASRRARSYMRLRKSRMHRGTPKSRGTLFDATHRPTLTAEQRAPRPCSTPSPRYTVSERYTEDPLKAMRDPEVLPVRCATDDDAYITTRR